LEKKTLIHGTPSKPTCRVQKKKNFTAGGGVPFTHQKPRPKKKWEILVEMGRRKRAVHESGADEPKKGETCEGRLKTKF